MLDNNTMKNFKSFQQSESFIKMVPFINKVGHSTWSFGPADRSTPSEQKTWTPQSMVWPPTWSRMTIVPTPEQWKKIWSEEVPHWSPTTQSHYQKLAAKNLKDKGMEPRPGTLTGLAMSTHARAFDAYFQQRWGLSIPESILSKILRGEGRVKWGDYNYNVYSERRELLLAMLTKERAGKAKSLARGVAAKIDRTIG